MIGFAQRRIAELLLEVVHLGLQVEQRLQRQAGFGDHRAPAVGQAVLRQVAERQRIGFLDDARIGLVEAGEHLEQRRLAGAVRAAQADAIAIADLPGDVLEQHLLAERFRDVLELQHEARLGLSLRLCPDLLSEAARAQAPAARGTVW